MMNLKILYGNLNLSKVSTYIKKFKTCIFVVKYKDVYIQCYVIGMKKAAQGKNQKRQQNNKLYYTPKNIKNQAKN